MNEHSVKKTILVLAILITASLPTAAFAQSPYPTTTASAPTSTPYASPNPAASPTATPPPAEIGACNMSTPGLGSIPFTVQPYFTWLQTGIANDIVVIQLQSAPPMTVCAFIWGDGTSDTRLVGAFFPGPISAAHQYMMGGQVKLLMHCTMQYWNGCWWSSHQYPEQSAIITLPMPRPYSTPVMPSNGTPMPPAPTP